MGIMFKRREKQEKLSGTAKVIENMALFGSIFVRKSGYDPAWKLPPNAKRVKKPGKYVSHKQRMLSLVKKKPKSFPKWLPDVIRADRGLKFS